MNLDDVVDTMSINIGGIQMPSISETSIVVSTNFGPFQPDSAEELEFEEYGGDISHTLKTKFTVADISLLNFSSILDRSHTSVRYGALLASMLMNDLKMSITA